jgi:hypothetical protein
MPFAFLAHEFISDRVADALDARALTPEEADMVLRATLAAVGRLHAQGYSHGDVRPGSVVAASDEVKLTGEHVAPLPSDELASRRAVSADLLAVGETATELLTRQRGPGAAATLPSPFAEFVRASVGTSECPHPTAEQLIGVLDGRELAGPPAAAPVVSAPVVSAPAEAPVSAAAMGSPEAVVSEAVITRPVPAERIPPTQPIPPRHTMAEAPRTSPLESDMPSLSEDRRSAGRRNGTVILAVFGVLVLSLVVWLGRRSKPGAVAPVPATASAPAQAAVPERSRATAPAPAAVRERWLVIAATYGNHAAAEKRAKSLAAKTKRVHPVVMPAEGKGKLYYVVVGEAESRKEAEKLRNQARSAGMPRETYVTRMSL